MQPLAIEHIAPSKLKPADYNPRTMSDKARNALKRGIEAFGLVDPIIARRKDKLVAGGHQRLHAAKELGLATVPVVFLDDLTDQKAAAKAAAKEGRLSAKESKNIERLTARNG